MGCEHSLTGGRAADVPEPNAVKPQGVDEGEVVVLDTELDIAHTLRLACGADISGGRRLGWGQASQELQEGE